MTQKPEEIKRRITEFFQLLKQAKASLLPGITTLFIEALYTELKEAKYSEMMQQRRETVLNQFFAQFCTAPELGLQFFVNVQTQAKSLGYRLLCYLVAKLQKQTAYSVEQMAVQGDDAGAFSAVLRQIQEDPPGTDPLLPYMRFLDERSTATKTTKAVLFLQDCTACAEANVHIFSELVPQLYNSIRSDLTVGNTDLIRLICHCFVPSKMMQLSQCLEGKEFSFFGNRVKHIISSSLSWEGLAQCAMWRWLASEYSGDINIITNDVIPLLLSGDIDPQSKFLPL